MELIVLCAGRWDGMGWDLGLMNKFLIPRGERNIRVRMNLNYIIFFYMRHLI